MELVQETSVMREYTPASRIWQGIPSVEVTRGGHLFVAFYSGGVKEEAGNYCLLYRLRENEECTLPVAVARTGEDGRCFDPALWMDPLGRLWIERIHFGKRLVPEIIEIGRGMGSLLDKLSVSPTAYQQSA